MLLTTGFYAALLGLFFIWLSANVIKRRVSEKIGHGNGDDDVLTRRRSAHSNFVSYVPMTLVVMATAESGNASTLLLHTIGITLLAGRVVHAIGITATPENFTLRKAGMVLTFLALAAACIANLMLAIKAMALV